MSFLLQEAQCFCYILPSAFIVDQTYLLLKLSRRQFQSKTMEVWNYRRHRDGLARRTIPLEKQPPRSPRRKPAASINKSLPVAKESRAGFVMGTASSKRRRKESGNNKVRFSPEKKSPSIIQVSNGGALLRAKDHQESQLAGIMISQPMDMDISVDRDDELSYSDSESSTEVWDGLEDSDQGEIQQAKLSPGSPKTSEPQHIIYFPSCAASASPPNIAKFRGRIISVEEGEWVNNELPKGKV